MKGNLANTYQRLGRLEEALDMKRDAYSGFLKLYGKEHEETLIAANNHAYSLFDLERLEETRKLLRKTIPVARRVLGESRVLTLRMKWTYARALYRDPGATLDDLREAVATFEDSERIARRVFGSKNPATEVHGEWLQYARAGLRAREVNVEVTKHMRSYLSPESLAVCRQLNHEWLRAIEDELRESRAALRAREDTPSASAV